jgi:hypothetical protein
MKIILSAALIFMSLSLGAFAESPETQAIFTPPQGWRFADPTKLPKHVKVMVVGKGSHGLPPSMNLGYEEFQGNLEDYLKLVKSINDSQGDVWKDLGIIQTEAGAASLSQLDSLTEWGPLKQMHAIFIQNGIAYILTAAALKEEFSQFYPVFFQSLRSLRIEKKERNE